MTVSRSLSLILGTVLALGAAPAAMAHESHCTVPMAEWQPREAVQALAEAQGLTVRRIKIDDGCYEVDALDAAGVRVRMRLDPGSLAVLRSGRGGHHGHDDHEGDDDDEGRRPHD